MREKHLVEFGNPKKKMWLCGKHKWILRNNKIIKTEKRKICDYCYKGD